MKDRQAAPADWVVPAILVGIGVGLLLVTGLVLAFTADDRVEESGLISELDVYTACLIGHGADVPHVEARRDGGFSVTVSGSLVDGDVDTAAWGKAHGQCSDVAPDVFGAFSGALFDGFLGGLLDGLPNEVPFDL